MEAGSSSSKLWIVADGQRAAGAGRDWVLSSGSGVVVVEHAAWDVAPADLASAWLVMVASQ